MQPKTFIFFGPSGSGKGTQAKLLQAILEKGNRKVIYIETGARFREFMESGSHTAKITKETMSAGKLLPAFLPIWVWADILVKNFTGNEDLILDGISRRIDEAPILDSIMDFYKLEDPYVINLNVSRDWSREHLLGRGRKDDTEEYINSRLDWYYKEVMPAIEYFKKHAGYKFLDINGEQSIDDVHKEIIAKVGDKLN